MSKIIINNLGPVKRFEANVDDKLFILIGEQASGKSTIAKAVFFCKSIADELKKYLMDSEEISKAPNNKMLTNFKKKLRTRFIEFFGTTKHMEKFNIEYEFNNSEKIFITLKEGYANIEFTPILSKECIRIAETVKKYYLEQEQMNFDQALNFKMWLNQNEKLTTLIDNEVNEIFEQIYTPLFIPAGRSMLSTNSEFFHTLKPNKYDILMNDFIERITILQKQYSQRMEDIVRDKKKLSTESIDFENVNKAMAIVKKILKGEYVNEKDGEKIYYNKNQFVKLIQASSGQQESLWIVLIILSVILNNQNVFLVIEEPEAHLFPKAQREMLDLIALMINATGSKVMLTTHSPYILTSTNLLMYSSYVEKDNRTKEDIVPYEYRISENDVSAYMIQNQEQFVIKNLMDRDNSMIDAAEIDAISEVLNYATDKLIELETANEG